MSSVVISGDTSGAITLSAPAVAGTNTLTLPAQTATIATLTTPSFASTIGVGGATASASGAGITFPATQSASTNANTLDDYEEGTFSPAPTPSAGSFASVVSAGRYTKIGRVVTVCVDIAIVGAGTGSGTLNFTIPFSTDGNTYVGEAIETASTGITGPALVNGTSGTIRKYDWSGVVIGSGYSWQSTVTYFVA
jgi:hypothetical protein